MLCNNIINRLRNRYYAEQMMRDRFHSRSNKPAAGMLKRAKATRNMRNAALVQVHWRSRNAESTSLVTSTLRCIRCIRVAPRANARSSVFARLSWRLWLWTKRREPVLQVWCIGKIGSCPCLGVDTSHDICSTLWSPVPWCFPFPNPSAEVLWMAIVWQALPMALLHCTQQAVAASSSTSYIWTADRGG